MNEVNFRYEAVDERKIPKYMTLALIIKVN